MAARKKIEAGVHSIMDAVEVLESLADLEFERDVDLATEEEITNQNHQAALKTIKWLGKEDPEEAAKLIKHTFHVIYDYLKDFYKKESQIVRKPQVFEGVKTIMVLVGEAAQKLDRFTTIFKSTKSRSVKALREYKQLQEFYLSRIARKIDEGVLGKWILELTKGAMARSERGSSLKEKKIIPTKYVFIDLESVRNDSSYELFFLKKEDGSRFFNPKLIRNIKLVCDFGETISSVKAADPFVDIKIWQDYAMHIAAKEIVRMVGGTIDRFFHEIAGSFHRELASEEYKAILALFLACNPKNLLKNFPVKTCTEYFIDFQCFLRNALTCREYQRLLAYPPKKAARLALFLLETVHALSNALFIGVHGYKELVPVFEKLLQEAVDSQSPEHKKAMKESGRLWNALAFHYSALKKLIKPHSNGPLQKGLDILKLDGYHVFDPIAQLNIPSQLYSLYHGAFRMTGLHLPTPTTQEFIQKSKIIEEFKGFLRANSQSNKKHLLFNLQDKTSWKEHARSLALEELQNNHEFSKTLYVVTLSKDTEFYYQAPPYNQDNHADSFIRHFKENISEESCGFSYPDSIKKKLFPHFVNDLIKAIHKYFFGNRNVLTLDNRRNFIEIFYVFLQLKILEIVEPDSFSFTCKDGLDAGGASHAQFYAFVNLMCKGTWSNTLLEQINVMLYMPALLIRERIILQDRFDRMTDTIKIIETAKEEKGEEQFRDSLNDTFQSLYSKSLRDWHL